MKRVILLMVVAALLRIEGSAEANDWGRVRALPAGAQVEVTTDSGPERKGIVQAITDDSLSLQESSGTVSLERARVRRVRVKDTARKVRRLAIGAGIGAAVGGIVAGVANKPLENEGSGCGACVAGVALGLGALGALAMNTSSWRTVYGGK